MLDMLLPTYNMGLNYCKKLAESIPDEQMCAQPVPGVTMNHAAFTIGHLAWVHDNVVKMLGLTPALPAEWTTLFAMGTKPLPDRASYPDKATLLRELEATHARLAEALSKASPETLAQPAPERMQRIFPTVGTMLYGLMSAHFGNHIGQLSAWRRALGYPSLF